MDKNDFSKMFLGFDSIVSSMWEDSFGKVKRFPHYNLIKKDEQTYLLEFALAGYSKEQLRVTVKNDVLNVSASCAENAEDPENDYIFKGISARPFVSSFVLSAGLRPTDVTFVNGLLTVTLVKDNDLSEELKIN